MKTVAVVDYGMGNLRSVSQAVKHVAKELSKLGSDIEVFVTADPAQVRAADRVVLPGQGAMRDCMHELASASAAHLPDTMVAVSAASLKAALANAQTAYVAANPGTTFAISTDSSSALETKIEQGAPVDVFLSADTANPQKLVDKGLAGGITKFARNHLTVIVPTANPAGIQTPADLAKGGLKALGKQWA